MKNTKPFTMQYKAYEVLTNAKKDRLLFNITFINKGVLKSSTLYYSDNSIVRTAKIEAAIDSLEKRLKRGLMKEVKVTRIFKV